MTVTAMAALVRGAKLVPWQFDTPPPGPFDCLVKTLACGLCRSDVHMIKIAKLRANQIRYRAVLIP